MATKNTKELKNLEGIIWEIRHLGEILSYVNINEDLDPNAISGIGAIISSTAEKAIGLLLERGAS